MFCLSVNVRKIKIAVMLILAAVTAAGIALVINNPEKNSIMLPDNTSRISFLNINGLDVCDKPYECISVNIPSEFNNIYQEYNKIQLEQGFDLSHYMGEKADIYTYQFSDNPDMLAVLILHDDKLIGADMHLSEYGSIPEKIIKRLDYN